MRTCSRLRLRPLQGWLVLGLLGCVSPAAAQIGNFDQAPVKPAEEALIFTPPGFAKPGEPAKAPSENAAAIQVRIADAATGQPTLCRVNVIGSDGNFYQPADNPYAPYSLLGNWPDHGQGNRAGKAPIRYFGHFFYTAGEFTVRVPAGETRIEVFKGFEYRPVLHELTAEPRQSSSLELTLQRTADASTAHYYGGDTHLHFPRGSDAEDRLIFDLLEAEDVRFGIVMCYNETNAYDGRMSQLIMPQYRGLGRRSVASRGNFAIVSGQEYRNQYYGHLNLFWRNDLVLAEQTLDPNQWPVYGVVGQQTRALGGYAFYAHGGYAQEIYADLAQGTVNGVELLQFGIYRGIGLEGWYHVLNAGLSCPALGASDYPACRKLSDCRTYVYLDEPSPTFDSWLKAAAAGRSFVTTAPVLIGTVDGQPPGTRIAHPGKQPRKVDVRLRVASETAPITRLQLIVNGEVVQDEAVAPDAAQGPWLERSWSVELNRSSWIALRACSVSQSGNADAEAHTNPVYVDFAGRAPFSAPDVQWLIERIDEQIAQHGQRSFDRSADVVAYFTAARDRLKALLAAGGAPAPADSPAPVSTSRP